MKSKNTVTQKSGMKNKRTKVTTKNKVNCDCPECLIQVLDDEWLMLRLSVSPYPKYSCLEVPIYWVAISRAVVSNGRIRWFDYWLLGSGRYSKIQYLLKLFQPA